MSRVIKLFLCGDVMLGRGIDRVLPHPSGTPRGQPPWENPLGYVELAEERNGPIPRPAPFDYVWGETLAELERARPGARIINLETTVTSSEERAPSSIHYRMHPGNLRSLIEARIDCCVLGNNHALDFGVSGLLETLESLEGAGLRHAGAGRDLAEASAPAVLELEGARVLVFSQGFPSSGVRASHAATAERPGVCFAAEPSEEEALPWSGRVRRFRRPGDLVVASLHWGPNFGYEVAAEEMELAHALIDRAGVDVVHGHSSHHPKGIELYKGKPILYGCGDLINDYEGIQGYEEFRDDLGFLYFVSMSPETGRLERLDLVPTRLKRFRLIRPSPRDAEWAFEVVRRESLKLGTRLDAGSRGLSWAVAEPAGR